MNSDCVKSGDIVERLIDENKESDSRLSILAHRIEKLEKLVVIVLYLLALLIGGLALLFLVFVRVIVFNS
jgi:hypothetical protein